MPSRNRPRAVMRKTAAIVAFAFLFWGAAQDAEAVNATIGIPPTSTLQMTSTTTAYTAGQLIANSATGANVVVPQFTLQNAGGPFTAITRGRLEINDTTASSWNGQTVTVDLWSVAPTFSNGDRNTFSPATGTTYHLGALTCVMSSVYGDGVYSECLVAVGNYISLSLYNPTYVYWTATATSGSGTTGVSKVMSFTPEIVN